MDSISSAEKLFTAANDVGRDRSPGNAGLAAGLEKLQLYVNRYKIGVICKWSGGVVSRARTLNGVFTLADLGRSPAPRP